MTIRDLGAFAWAVVVVIALAALLAGIFPVGVAP
jgi:hypothetical protein